MRYIVVTVVTGIVTINPKRCKRKVRKKSQDTWYRNTGLNG